MSVIYCNKCGRKLEAGKLSCCGEATLSKDTWELAYEQGRRAERADVVAYLNTNADAQLTDYDCNFEHECADAIERLEHINAAKTDEVKNG
jgi:hypothetical protein